MLTPLCASMPSEKRSKAVKKATELHSNKTPAVIPMARAVKDIQREIRELSSEDKVELIRTLIADLDAPADSNVERAWLETSQRRYRELVEGKVKGVPGPPVFERLRKRLGR